MEQSRNILLVDDHPIVVVAMRALIEARSGEYQFHCASSGSEAMELAKKHRPWLVILDLSLPDCEGLSLIKDLRSVAGGSRVLIFSMQSEIQHGPRAMKAGANGYLMKGAPVPVIYDAIDQISRGGVYCSRTLAEHMAQGYGKGARLMAVDELSPREFQVFQLLGEGYSAREIGEKLKISRKTVDSHRENMKLKLQKSSTRELYFMARDWVRSQSVGGGHSGPGGE